MLCQIAILLFWYGGPHEHALKESENYSYLKIQSYILESAVQPKKIGSFQRLNASFGYKAFLLFPKFEVLLSCHF